jgi:hypothetical protein
MLFKVGRFVDDDIKDLDNENCPSGHEDAKDLSDREAECGDIDNIEGFGVMEPEVAYRKSSFERSSGPSSRDVSVCSGILRDSHLGRAPKSIARGILLMTRFSCTR